MNNKMTILALAVSAAFACGAPLPSQIVVQKKYLHIPVARDGEEQMVYLMRGAEVIQYSRIALPKNKSEALYWTSVDIGSLKGETLTAKGQPAGPELGIAQLCEQSDEIRKPPSLYQEEFRPQFHFSAPTGWLNDPNGLVFFDGEYHLFYQHNPYGIGSANKSWGHAISRDLIHWTDYGDALLPDRLGAIYSGSAVVDRANASGLQSGPTLPLIAIYTSAGGHSYEKLPYTQSLAYSNDRGRTWKKYDKNPIIGHIEGTNRDPKVFWHKQSDQWIMALYLARGKFLLMGSKNLREWEKLSDLDFPDGHECPELFELPVDGDRRNSRWVMWEGAGRYMIGRFDGKKFMPETNVLPSEWGSHLYAGQTWNGVRDDRRIFIGWMRANEGKVRGEATYPNMPFNQQMSFPRDLSLRTTSEGIRLVAQPAREIEKLYGKQYVSTEVALTDGRDALAGVKGELFDIRTTLELRRAKSIKLEIRGTSLTYDAVSNELSCLGKSVHLAPLDGRLNLRVIVDRTSIEIFASGGRYVMSFCFKPDKDNRGLRLTAEGGTAMVKSLRVSELKAPTGSRALSAGGAASQRAPRPDDGPPISTR